MEAFSENYKCIFGREYNNASPSSHLFWWLKMRMWIHLFCIWTMFNVSVCVVYGGILLLIIPYFTISCHLSVWPEAEAEEDNKINAPKILRAGKRSNRNLELCWDMRNLFKESSAWFTYQIMIFLDFWNQNYWLIFDPTKKTVKLSKTWSKY